VTNVGTDRSQLANVAKETKTTLEATSLDVVADRGYFSSGQILACEEAGITVTLPKPMTSNSKTEGRFGKQDFRYVLEEDVYICPAGERLAYSFTTEENELVMRRYSTNACQRCAIKQSCTTGKERRITRWEHEHLLETVQRRLDEHPEKMRQRREGCRRDGTSCAGLQSHARHEHQRYPTADGGDAGIVVPDMRSSAREEPPKTLISASGARPDRKSRQLGKMTAPPPRRQARDASRLPLGRFYTTKTQS